MLVFLTLVGAALLGLVVVVIYLNDRVNELERRTAAGLAGGVAPGAGSEDNSWHGLTGKRLWDAMCGKKGITALDEAGLQALRQTYEGVLSKHIESLFRAGQADARKGGAVQPTAVKTLASARGAVQSWIPLNHANALYRAGIDSIKTDIYEVERARMTLDDTAQLLFSQTGLSLAQPFSDLLLGNGGSVTGQDPGVEGAALATDAAADTWAQAPAAPPMPGTPSAGAAAIPPAGGMFTASTGTQDSSSR
jgi:hypothetical protein